MHCQLLHLDIGFESADLASMKRSYGKRECSWSLTTGKFIVGVNFMHAQKKRISKEKCLKFLILADRQHLTTADYGPKGCWPWEV